MRRALGALARVREAPGAGLMRPQQQRWLSSSKDGFGKFQQSEGDDEPQSRSARTESLQSKDLAKDSRVRVADNNMAQPQSVYTKGRAMTLVTKKPAKDDPHADSGKAGLRVARQQTDRYYKTRGERKPGVKDYTWIKQKSPFKRAASLITELNMEDMVAAEKKRAIPNFRTGDAVQVSYAVSTESTKVVTVRGLVIGRKSAMFNSSFRLKCVIGPDPIEFIFPLYSPLLREILVIDEAYLHRGKKRVRRSKIYYVDQKPLALYTVNEAAVRRMYFRMDNNGTETDEARARILGISLDELGGKLVPPPDDTEAVGAESPNES